MFLHLGKTEFILFDSAAKPRCVGSEVKVGHQIITPKHEVKYLGCILNSILTGENMAVPVYSKKNCSKKIKFLARQQSSYT